jgi:hypothetical protein
MQPLVLFLLAFLLTACTVTSSPAPAGEADRVTEAEQLIRFSLTDRIIADLHKRSSRQFVQILTASQVPEEQAERMVAEELNSFLPKLSING